MRKLLSAQVISSLLRRRGTVIPPPAKAMNGKLARRFVVTFLTLLAFAAGAAAQTVVFGSGDPNIDVPAVQAAVDQGGQVVLKGHFSFNRLPTVPTATAFVGGLATVLVSKAVAITGAQDRDEDDEMTTIEGGTTPFYVEAPGARVAIQKLRFIRPKGDAIFVYAVSGLVIASCEIDGVVPLPGFGGDGIDISTSGGVPSPANPGKPEKISGTLLIANNNIDAAAGTAVDNMLGVLIFSVGVPGAEVEALVSGNKIKNVTEPAINFRHIVGRAYIERNGISTGSVASRAAPGPEVIRVANTGSYLIVRNSIHCEWADPAAKGIGVFSQVAAWPVEQALVEDNDVEMEAPEGTVFVVPGSAGIDIRGFAQGNAVLNNKIRGGAGAALSVEVFKGGIPNNNAFILNRLDDFEASLADVFVGPGGTNTLAVEPGTIVDHGTGTTIVPVPF